MQVPLRTHWTDPIRKLAPKSLLALPVALLVFGFMRWKPDKDPEAIQDGLRFVLSDGGGKLSVSLTDDSEENIAFPALEFGRVKWGDQVWLIDGREDKPTSLEQDQYHTLGLRDLVYLRPGMVVSFDVVPRSGGSLIIEPHRHLSDDVKMMSVHQAVHIWNGHVEFAMP